MIHTEIFENNGKQYQRTWSDDFTLIQQPSGIEYYEAVDVLPTKWTYTESENEKPNFEQNLLFARTKSQNGINIYLGK